MADTSVSDLRAAVELDTRTDTFPDPALVRVAAATLWDAAGGSTVGQDGTNYFVTVSPGAIRFRRKDATAHARALAGQPARHAKALDLRSPWKADADTVTLTARRCEPHFDAETGRWSLPGSTLPDDGQTYVADAKGSRSRIFEWSPKSRANMTYRLLTLEYGDLVRDDRRLAMITLTMPDRWEPLAPTGAAFKALVHRYTERYARAWGERLVGIWKLEFQSRECDLGCRCSRRGAPHLHALVAPPHGRAHCTDADCVRRRKDDTIDCADELHRPMWRDWFAGTWSDILTAAGHDVAQTADDHIDAELTRALIAHVHRQPLACANYADGERMKDPKRIAVYFNKHGLLDSKSYQHNVPEIWREPGHGPGRFWGVWGLAVVEHSAELTRQQLIEVTRIVRKLERSRGAIRTASVWRTDIRTGVMRKRLVRRRVQRLRGSFGFLAVNDGASYALMLATVLAKIRLTT